MHQRGSMACGPSHACRSLGAQSLGHVSDPKTDVCIYAHPTPGRRRAARPRRRRRGAQEPAGPGPPGGTRCARAAVHRCGFAPCTRQPAFPLAPCVTRCALPCACCTTAQVGCTCRTWTRVLRRSCNPCSSPLLAAPLCAASALSERAPFPSPRAGRRPLPPLELEVVVEGLQGGVWRSHATALSVPLTTPLSVHTRVG